MAEELLVEVSHAHRLHRLHAALALGCERDRVPRHRVDKLLVRDLPVAVGVTIFDELAQPLTRDRDVPQVEGARNLLLAEQARAVEVHVLEGLEHVREARVHCVARLVGDIAFLELLGRSGRRLRRDWSWGGLRGLCRWRRRPHRWGRWWRFRCGRHALPGNLLAGSLGGRLGLWQRRVVLPKEVVVDGGLDVLDVLVAEELLVEVSHAHRLHRVHVTLAHRRERHRVAGEAVDKLLVGDLAIAIHVACGHEVIELRVADRDVPQVERARDLLLADKARAVEIDELESLEHVRVARVHRVARLLEDGAVRLRTWLGRWGRRRLERRLRPDGRQHGLTRRRRHRRQRGSAVTAPWARCRGEEAVGGARPLLWCRGDSALLSRRDVLPRLDVLFDGRRTVDALEDLEAVLLVLEEAR